MTREAAKLWVVSPEDVHDERGARIIDESHRITVTDAATRDVVEAKQHVTLPHARQVSLTALAQLQTDSIES